MAIQGTHSPEKEDKAPTERNFPLLTSRLRGPAASGVKGRKGEPSAQGSRHSGHAFLEPWHHPPWAECLVPGDTLSGLGWRGRGVLELQEHETVRLCPGHPVWVSLGAVDGSASQDKFKDGHTWRLTSSPAPGIAPASGSGVLILSPQFTLLRLGWCVTERGRLGPRGQAVKWSDRSMKQGGQTRSGGVSGTQGNLSLRRGGPL